VSADVKGVVADIVRQRFPWLHGALPLRRAILWDIDAGRDEYGVYDRNQYVVVAEDPGDNDMDKNCRHLVRTLHLLTNGYVLVCWWDGTQEVYPSWAVVFANPKGGNGEDQE